MSHPSPQQQDPDYSGWSFYDPPYTASSPSSQGQQNGALPPSFTGTPSPLSPSSQGYQALQGAAHGARGGSRRRPWYLWAALLFAAILLGALGATPIFAGGGGGTNQPTATPAPVKNTPTPASTPTVKSRSTPTPVSTPTPTPASAPTPTPAPPAPVAGQPGNLPASWTDSGRGAAEFDEAATIAEDFTYHYDTLDWRSKNSFRGSTFAMTQGALARFNSRDDRANAAFIAQFQKEHQVLAARVHSSLTRLLQAQQVGQQFFAWFLVDYSLRHEQTGRATFQDEHSMVVLLEAQPFGSNNVVGGVGWLVSDWQDNSTAIIPLPFVDQGGS